MKMLIHTSKKRSYVGTEVKMQIRNNFGQEETAIAAFHVTDGIDQCRFGFLPCHFAPHALSFDGVLAQVTEVYSL